MPKAKPFPEGDEEEKTTIESQWEDEASTTVEEGDVADKIRSLVEPRRNNTNVTHTGAGALDEPTVDDQHAQLSAITPLRDVARLQITAGNDAGTEIEIRPGKTYTIGRAIDNDVVLTDIAVSRKHFDLRFEDGAWVIVDRGSGNGTVVNGNLEDNPFMLANADVIEIGNTVFRFDQPNAAARPQRTLDIDQDEEEMSTVAGKPMRSEIVEVIEQPTPVAARAQRAKTLPPPTPLRSANASQPPPLGYPPPGPVPLPPSAVSLPIPQPASTLPLPQMANRAPMMGPGAPTMLGDQLGLPPNVMGTGGMANSGLPTTIPGQGAPPPRGMYPSYPQAADIPPHSVHAQMLLIQTQNRRGDNSTMHVPPTPYDGVPQQIRYSTPQLSKRTKLVLGGVALAVFAAVMTVAITKSGSGKQTSVAGAERAKADGKKTKATAKPQQAAMPTAEPIETKVAAKTAETAPTPTTTTTTTPATTATTPPPATTSPQTASPSTTTAPVTTVAKTEPKVEPKAAPKAEPRPEPRVAKAKTEAARPKRERTPPRRVEAPKPTPAPTRVAAAVDPEVAKDQADSLYRAKKFSEASSYLASAAKKVEEEDAREMRRTSEMYARLGRALAQGTAPATKSTEAFEALRQAQNFDRSVGNAFDGEIQTKLAQVAPKAALSYMAAKNYSSARTAVIAAQQFGSSESVKLVSQKLESVAGELYNEGMRELSGNPSGAKEKFRQITTIVDSKSSWYQKAQKQLRGG